MSITLHIELREWYDCGDGWQTTHQTRKFDTEVEVRQYVLGKSSEYLTEGLDVQLETERGEFEDAYGEVRNLQVYTLEVLGGGYDRCPSYYMYHKI